MAWGWFRRRLRPVERRVDAAAIVRQARRLRYRVRPGSVSLLAGLYHGARPGVGLTFAELKAYEPGDDVRHLDWNVTARLGRPFVRRFIEERSLVLWLVVDVSASMHFASDGPTKADRAAQTAALLATAALQNGDNVGLLLVSDQIELELPPAGGARRLARIVRALVAAPTVSAKTKLGVATDRLSRAGRRALVVVVSDFLSDEKLVWRSTARRHDMILFRVVDPREAALPEAGLLALEASEDGARLKVDSSSPQLRARYAEAAQRRARAFARLCSSTGVQGFTMSTDVDPLRALTELFRSRAARRRGP